MYIVKLKPYKYCVTVFQLSCSVGKFVYFVFPILPSLFQVHSNFYYLSQNTFLLPMWFTLLFPTLRWHTLFLSVLCTSFFYYWNWVLNTLHNFTMYGTSNSNMFCLKINVFEHYDLWPNWAWYKITKCKNHRINNKNWLKLTHTILN